MEEPDKSGQLYFWKFQRCSGTTCNDGSSWTRLHLHPSTGKDSTTTHCFTSTFSAPRRAPTMESLVLVHQWKTDVAVIVIVIGNYMVEYVTLRKSSTVARVATKWVAKSKVVGEVVNTVPLSPHLLFCNILHIRSFFFQITPADIGECRAHDGEWRQNTSPETAHTHIFLFAHRVVQLFRIWGTFIGSRLDESSQHACRELKTVRLLHSHSFISCLVALPGPAWALFYFSWWTGSRIGDLLQRSQRRSLVWPNGRTVPAHRILGAHGKKEKRISYLERLGKWTNAATQKERTCKETGKPNWPLLKNTVGQNMKRNWPSSGKRESKMSKKRMNGWEA